MKLIVTILEPSPDAAVRAIESLRPVDHDGIEVRAELFGEVDLDQFRRATDKLLILTYRGHGPVSQGIIERAIAAGFDYVDVEYDESLDRALIARHARRIILSHHDYQSVSQVETLVAAMRAFGAAHTKLAATPNTLAENRRLLDMLKGEPGLSVIGMGEHGLYSRILAPFLGSALSFVSADDTHRAAPGQISLQRALEIYGPDRDHLHAAHIFAVAGNPAGHSLSPAIHNALFREAKLPAAYTIASFESFSPLGEAVSRGEISGLSITAPFKEEAFAFAERIGAGIGDNARASGAVNTMVNAGRIIADNTDVDGFAALLSRIPRHRQARAAVVGAGGTSRAALVALSREGMHTTIFNRTLSRAVAVADRFHAEARPLEELAQFDGEVILDTTPGNVELDVRPGVTVIRAAYSGEKEPSAFDGLDLLRAQAVRQHHLFRMVFDAR